jgi:hypothetical protein
MMYRVTARAMNDQGPASPVPAGSESNRRRVRLNAFGVGGAYGFGKLAQAFERRCYPSK